MDKEKAEKLRRDRELELGDEMRDHYGTLWRRLV